MTTIEVHYKADIEDDELEPLRMEHFYFPGGLWLMGTVLSVLGFLAEIVTHRPRKSKSDVPVEEPGVTQFT